MKDFPLIRFKYNVMIMYGHVTEGAGIDYKK